MDKNNFLFTPSQDVDDNTAFVSFNPLLDEQGKYTLKVVVSDDNKRYADQEYEVSFFISERSLISDTRIFPNPISSYAQIDVVLDGGDLPPNFSIRIYDSSGRNVENISRSDFQNIRTGANTRSHLWLAKDDEGKILPSGSYVFVISGKKAGETVQLNHKVVLVR